MYQNIAGCRAEKLDNHNGQVIFSGNSKIKEITFSPYVSVETLQELIDMNLQKVENETKITSAVLKELQQLVSMLPSDFVSKDEYKSRLKSITNLYFVANEMENVMTDTGTNHEERLSKVNQLDALLKEAFHGPLRSLLEEKVNNVMSTIKAQSKEEVNDQNLVCFINNAQTAEEIDEILCEIFVEEYVNSRKKVREIVAKQLFELAKSYHSNKEIMDDLNGLISKFNEDAQNHQLFKEDVEVLLSNVEESHKQTLDIHELELVIKSATTKNH
jgi:hypothetical protein